MKRFKSHFFLIIRKKDKKLNKLYNVKIKKGKEKYWANSIKKKLGKFIGPDDFSNSLYFGIKFYFHLKVLPLTNRPIPR